MYNQLLIKHNHFIQFYIMLVMYSRHYFYETAVRSDCFSFILLQNDWIYGSLCRSCSLASQRNALWENYSTILWYWWYLFISYWLLSKSFFFYICHLLSILECYIIIKVFLCVMLFFIMFMCDHLKNKSPVVQYFAMFASPDYYINLCIHKV